MEKILFPTEFGPLGIKAESNAILIAKKFDAELVLLHAFNVPSGLSSLFSDVNEDEIRKRAQVALDKYAEELRTKGGIKVSTAVQHNNRPEVAIVEVAKELNVKFVIFGTKGGSGLRDTLLGSAVNHVIRHTPCPVFTVRNEPEAAGFNRILIPMDLAKEAGEKVEKGVEIAKAYGASIYIYAAMSGGQEEQRKLQERVQWSREYAYKNGVKDVHATFEESTGSVADAVLGYADQVDADLVCIMTQQESEAGIKTTVLGSVADRITNISQRPVMSIRPERHYKSSYYESPLFT